MILNTQLSILAIKTGNQIVSKRRKQKKMASANEKPQNVRYFSSSHDKKVVFKEIAHQFTEWPSWQRQNLLCRCTEQSSLSLITSLSTVLEPIFHRDFDIITHGTFKSALVKNFVCLPEIIHSQNFNENLDIEKSQTLSDSVEVMSRKTKSNRTKSPFEGDGLDQATSEKIFPSHVHALPRKTDSLSTIEFYNDLNQQKLATGGRFIKPCSVKHGCLSMKDYKHEKWWLPDVKQQKCFQSVSKIGLLRCFNNISNTFIDKYASWRDAEKGDFLLHIVDFCSPMDLRYLASCIHQRQKEIGDIDRLPDKLLIKIFEHLDFVDVTRTAQVNKRWKVLSSSDSLWKKKCYELAFKHNQIEFLTNIESYSGCLDWKLLYHDLSIKQLIIQDDKIPDEALIETKIQENTEEESDGCFDNCSEMNMEFSILCTDNYAKTMSNIADKSLLEVTQNSYSNLSVCKGEQTTSLPGNLSNQENTHTYVDDVVDDNIALDVRLQLVQADNCMWGKRKERKKTKADEEFLQVTISGMRTLKRVRKFQGHLNAVLCVQFDTKRVMSGSADRTIRLWDVRSGRNFQKIDGHQGGVRSLFFDDKYIVTGSWDTTVMIWHVVRFTLLHTITEHRGCVSSVDMNNTILVTASHDGTACVFRKHTWKLIATLEGHEGVLSCLLLLGEDQLITGSYDRKVFLWDLKTFTILKTFEGARTSILTVKVRGDLLAAGSSDGTVSFWDLTSCFMEGMVKAHDGPCNAICFVGSKFVTGGGDSLVKEWDLSTCTCLRSFTGHKAAVNCVRASSKRIISGSSDGTVRVWDLVCNLQQVGGPYDEMNKNIIQSEVLHENEFKKRNLKIHDA